MTTSNILMIRPAAFGYNPQTAVNNLFQIRSEQNDIHGKALGEFDDFVGLLDKVGVNVTVVQDVLAPHTPDSIFPNNWVSFHEEGTVVLYPMFAPNRQLERTKDVLRRIEDRFAIRLVVDLSVYEDQKMFLEGTGSMILDRNNKIAYACMSPRTNSALLYFFCNTMGYHPVLFNAVDALKREIYHTNVMMCVANEYVVICMSSVRDETQRSMLLSKFEETGKQVIEIDYGQIEHFAGNMLQVQNRKGEPLLVMSSQAYKSLNKTQIQQLESFNALIHTPLDTIERNGGGSARCMMAEIFLEPAGTGT